MQTGLTDAPSGLEIYVCGLSFNAPPHPTPTPPLLFFLPLSNSISEPHRFSSFQNLRLKEEGKKKRSNTQPTLIFLFSHYPCVTCSAPHSLLFPSLHFFRPLC